MKYYVRMGEVTREVTVDGETVMIDGRTIRARLEDLEGTPIQLVTIGDEVHRMVARRGTDRGQLEISLQGHRMMIEALDERSKAIRDLSGASRKSAAPTHLHAPMPGLIVRVNVGDGDEVRAGQGIVVIEAMKMENELKATVNGVVKRVVVSPGSAVEKGALLVEMEPAK